MMVDVLSLPGLLDGGGGGRLLLTLLVPTGERITALPLVGLGRPPAGLPLLPCL